MPVREYKVAITRDLSRDKDKILDCKRPSARDGVAITMSGLSESNILGKKARHYGYKIFFECVNLPLQK